MTRGWFTFVHHDYPVEWSDGIEERYDAIRQTKPVSERATRLQCIVRVPDELVPPVYAQAHAASNRAMAEVKRERVSVYAGQPWTIYDQAMATYIEARGAYYQARDAVAAEVLSLALRLVPDAPWRDGALRFTKDEGPR